MAQRTDEERATREGRIDKPGWKRLAWFVGLWAGSVAVLAAFGYALRFVLL